jgi:hypothetical protein
VKVATSACSSATKMGQSSAANSRMLLAAAAAGRDGLGRHRAHRHRLDAAAAGGHHRGDGRGFGAPALRVGGVLDVAAGVDAAGSSSTAAPTAKRE